MASAVAISVQSDLKTLAARFPVDNQKMIAAAAVRALNRAGTTVRKEASKEIRKRYNIRSSAAKDQIDVSKASASRLEARVRARGKRVPLIQFLTGSASVGGVTFRARAGRLSVAGSRGRSRPLVRVQVLREGGSKVLRNAFVAVMPGGHVGIFERTGQWGRRGKPSLERIKQLYTLSIAQAFGQQQVMERLKAIGAERFRIEFAREMKFRSGRLNG